MSKIKFVSFKQLSAIAGLLIASVVGFGHPQEAAAHTFRLGWKGNNDGSMTFYGASYHSPYFAYDDFNLNPSGLVLQGNNFTFDLDSVVSTISGDWTLWNNLSLDDDVFLGSGTLTTGGGIRKFASVTLSSTDLTNLGLLPGQSQQVTLSTFSNNLDWEPYPGGQEQATIEVPSVTVPEPTTIAGTFLACSFGLLLSRKGKKRQ